MADRLTEIEERLAGMDRSYSTAEEADAAQWRYELNVRADIEYLLGEIRRLAGKQEDALRCLYAFVNCQQRAGDTCNEWLADSIRALRPDPGEEARDAAD